MTAKMNRVRWCLLLTTVVFSAFLAWDILFTGQTGINMKFWSGLPLVELVVALVSGGLLVGEFLVFLASYDRLDSYRRPGRRYKRASSMDDVVRDYFVYGYSLQLVRRVASSPARIEKEILSFVRDTKFGVSQQTRRSLSDMTQHGILLPCASYMYWVKEVAEWERALVELERNQHGGSPKAKQMRQKVRKARLESPRVFMDYAALDRERKLREQEAEINRLTSQLGIVEAQLAHLLRKEIESLRSLDVGTRIFRMKVREIEKKIELFVKPESPTSESFAEKMVQRAEEPVTRTEIPRNDLGLPLEFRWTKEKGCIHYTARFLEEFEDLDPVDQSRVVNAFNMFAVAGSTHSSFRTKPLKNDDHFPNSPGGGFVSRATIWFRFYWILEVGVLEVCSIVRRTSTTYRKR